MSSLFDSPKVEAPAPQPTVVDATAAADAAANAKAAKANANKAVGAQQTNLTSGLGDPSNPTTSKKLKYTLGE